MSARDHLNLQITHHREDGNQRLKRNLLLGRHRLNTGAELASLWKIPSSSRCARRFPQIGWLGAMSLAVDSLSMGGARACCLRLTWPPLVTQMHKHLTRFGWTNFSIFRTAQTAVGPGHLCTKRIFTMRRIGNEIRRLDRPLNRYRNPTSNFWHVSFVHSPWIRDARNSRSATPGFEVALCPIPSCPSRTTLPVCLWPRPTVLVRSAPDLERNPLPCSLHSADICLAIGSSLTLAF